MSLTRKALATMGLEEAQIDQIIEMHVGVTSELKEERDSYKADAEKLPKVQKELDELKETVEKQNGENPFEVKYNALKEEFESYKTEIATKETKAKKEKAFKDILKEAGVSEKRIDSVARVSTAQIDGIEFNKDGSVKDADKIAEGVKTEWSDFIVETKAVGANTANPPTTTGGGMTKAEIMKITDRAKRREAIAENPQAFGISVE